MEIILCTKEAADDYLMHWRTKGSKNGVRRWQYENGSLTPEGYKHYAEMYGWGNKLKKAERFQNRADKAADKAERASRKADDDYVKSYKAERKNERWSTERRQEKADRAKEIADESKAKSDLLSVKARQAQNKASDYADKLQRKEDKMSKYVKENGDLNTEAWNKYTYATGLPGERKMSLIGRLKFGNEYANKFNAQHKSKMTKEEVSNWESSEKAEFDIKNEWKQKSRELIEANFAISDQRVEILKKNDAWSKVKDPSTFPKEDQDKLAELDKKMSENRKAYADAEYEHSKALEDNYAKTVKSEKDVDWIDPKYRKFSSKEEKAAAEEAYFKKINEEPSDDDIAKWNREVGHLSNTISNLSLDGYMGLPKSPRQKAEYNYVDTDDNVDTYDNWRPKYEKTKEWTDLETERSRIKRDAGVDKAEKTWRSAKIGTKQREKAWKDFISAQDKYNEQAKSIDAKEREIRSKFHMKQLKNLCLDLGYEPTKSNMMFLESWCWYD